MTDLVDVTYPPGLDPSETPFWCGPTAIASAYNLPYEVVVAVLKDNMESHPKRSNWWMSWQEVIDVVSEIRGPDAPAVIETVVDMMGREFLEGRSKTLREQTLLLNYGVYRRGHLVAVRGDKAVDTFSRGKVIAVSELRRQRRFIGAALYLGNKWKPDVEYLQPYFRKAGYSTEGFGHD